MVLRIFYVNCTSSGYNGSRSLDFIHHVHWVHDGFQASLPMIHHFRRVPFVPPFPVVSSAPSLLPKGSCVLGVSAPPCLCFTAFLRPAGQEWPPLLCGYCFPLLPFLCRCRSRAKALAGKGYGAGHAVWTGQPKPPRRKQQGHPGLQRPQREDRDSDEDRVCRSAYKAGPAHWGGTGCWE